MAAKAAAPAAAKVTAKATAQAAAPKGLQLTTAQYSAFNKAYKATATATRNKLALQSAATRYRKFRLQAANATVKKAAAARGTAQAAAVAANATRMSYVQSKLAHQNSALQARIEQDMYTHTNTAGKLQYIAAGEKAYAHQAVMRTVDQSQSLSHENAVFKALAKTAKKASKSTLPPFKVTPNSKAVAAAASAAGLSAAKAVKAAPAKAAAVAPVAAKARTAPKFSPMPGGAVPDSPVNQYAAAMASAHAMWGGAAPPRKPPVVRTWVGDEVTPNCVIAAIANHLLSLKGIRATDGMVKELQEACSDAPLIEEVLWVAYLIGWPGRGTTARLGGYRPVYDTPEDAGLVIGFEVMTDSGWRDHAALSLPGYQVVSWGAVTDREAPVEEAWRLTWEY